MLSGEPWNWCQRKISRHTDWYLWEIVIRPAIRKAKKIEEENKDMNKSGVGKSRGKFKLPSRDQYATVGEKLGIPRATSEKEYDRYIAAQKKNGNG